MSYCAKCSCGQVFMGRGKMPKDQRCAVCKTPKSKKTKGCKHDNFFNAHTRYGDDSYSCDDCGEEAQKIISDLQEQVAKLKRSKARLKKKLASVAGGWRP